MIYNVYGMFLGEALADGSTIKWTGGLIKTRKIFDGYWDVLSGSRTRLGGFQEEVKVQTDSGITNTPPFKNTKA